MCILLPEGTAWIQPEVQEFWNFWISRTYWPIGGIRTASHIIGQWHEFSTHALNEPTPSGHQLWQPGRCHLSCDTLFWLKAALGRTLIKSTIGNELCPFVKYKILQRILVVWESKEFFDTNSWQIMMSMLFKMLSGIFHFDPFGLKCNSIKIKGEDSTKSKTSKKIFKSNVCA